MRIQSVWKNLTGLQKDKSKSQLNTSGVTLNEALGPKTHHQTPRSHCEPVLNSDSGPILLYSCSHFCFKCAQYQLSSVKRSVLNWTARTLWTGLPGFHKKITQLLLKTSLKLSQSRFGGYISCLCSRLGVEKQPAATLNKTVDLATLPIWLFTLLYQI